MRYALLALLLTACSDKSEQRTDTTLPDTTVAADTTTRLDAVRPDSVATEVTPDVPPDVPPDVTTLPDTTVSDTVEDTLACETARYQARSPSAAMLTVLDASASMSRSNKWATASTAIVAAIDADAFDDVSLGLTVFPSGYVEPPPCICAAVNLSPADCAAALAPGVSCGFPIEPQVPLAPAGSDKTTAESGVRRAISDWLVSHAPLSNADDGSPVYDSLVAGYAALRAAPVERRVLVLLTDGGFSCTSVASTERASYDDGNLCPDWEQPDSVNALIATARADADAPIATFVIGVPGSNSTGQKVDDFDTPPYDMLLALSTYAVSGSPSTVDPACSHDAVFTQAGSAPEHPCHIDLSDGSAFNSDALTERIASIRRDALGCVFDLPSDGGAVDPALVNVLLTLDGTQTTVPKRANSDDTCSTTGCWDYTNEQRVELLGKACADLSVATHATVDLQVGCTTVQR